MLKIYSKLSDISIKKLSFNAFCFLSEAHRIQLYKPKALTPQKATPKSAPTPIPPCFYLAIALQPPRYPPLLAHHKPSAHDC